MSLHIAQDFEYTGDDHWSWRAWIAGGDAQLERVRAVRWLLHSSFSPSVVVRDDRSTGFRLETSGWGTFLLRAEVQFEDGEKTTLRHDLQLEYPDGGDEPGAAAPRSPTKRGGASRTPGEIKTVFLSYGSADQRSATVCRDALEKLGIAVTDATSITPGSPLELAIADRISNVDATIALVSGDIPSTFVAQEINASLSAGKPTLVLTDAAPGPMLGVNDGAAVQHFDSTNVSRMTDTLNSLQTRFL